LEDARRPISRLHHGLDVALEDLTSRREIGDDRGRALHLAEKVFRDRGYVGDGARILEPLDRLRHRMTRIRYAMCCELLDECVDVAKREQLRTARASCSLRERRTDGDRGFVRTDLTASGFEVHDRSFSRICAASTSRRAATGSEVESSV